MPLFFFLAGLTYNAAKYSNFKVFIKNKAVTLLIPYAIFAIVTYLWNIFWQLLEGNFSTSSVIKQGVGIFLNWRTSPYSIGVWFIPCIFIAFIFMWIILKISRGNKMITLILSTICLICGYLYCTYIDVKLPWAPDAALVAVFFMIVGFLLKERLSAIHTTHRTAILLMLTFAAISITFTYINYTGLNRTVGMWSNNYGNLVYFILGAFSGIGLTIFIANYTQINPIINIGKNSIYYYGLHGIILSKICNILGIVSHSGVLVATALCIVSVVLTLSILRICLKLYKILYNKLLALIKR